MKTWPLSFVPLLLLCDRHLVTPLRNVCYRECCFVMIFQVMLQWSHIAILMSATFEALHCEVYIIMTFYLWYIFTKWHQNMKSHSGPQITNMGRLYCEVTRNWHRLYCEVSAAMWQVTIDDWCYNTQINCHCDFIIAPRNDGFMCVTKWLRREFPVNSVIASQRNN